PDALVTDLRMPHADGVAVARFARSRRQDLPVLVVTGYPELVPRPPNDLVPAPTVLNKPLEYATLSQALRRATDRAGSGQRREGWAQRAQREACVVGSAGERRPVAAPLGVLDPPLRGADVPRGAALVPPRPRGASLGDVEVAFEELDELAKVPVRL